MKFAVLVVEDSRLQARALADVLEDEYAITVAHSGEEALERLAENRFDLVLSDIVMPGVSGYDLCRTVKTTPEWEGTPVVLLTGRVDPMDIVCGLEAGADNYITKPYEPEHLLARIGHVLANQRLRRASRTSMGVTVQFLGRELTITSEKEQVLDLLLSSVEDMIRTNRALEASRRELAAAHEALEAYARAKTREAESSTERYRTLMQHAGDAILVVDREGTIVEANARAAELLGVPVDGILGRRMEEFVAGALREGLGEALGAGEATTIEQALLNARGHEVRCEITFSRIRLESGELLMAICRDVTERHGSQARLRARERQLAEAQHIAGVGSWEWDLGSDTLHASEEMYRIFGVDRDALRESLAEDFLARIVPEDSDRVWRGIELATQGSTRYDIEYRVDRGGGDIVMVHARGEVIRDEHGAAVRIVGSAQDITERKRAEARLEESEQRYRSLFEYNPDAIFSLDLEGRLTSANPACNAITGYEPGALLGHLFDPLVVREHRALARRHFQGALGGEPQTYHLSIQTCDDRRLELSVTNTPIRVGGEVVGVFGIAKDITHHVRAQEALRRSEETLRTVVDASPVGILVLATDGRVLNWSTAAERMFGWTADEARAHPHPPFLPPDRVDEFRALCARVLAGESLLGLELIRLRKDGSEIPISLSVSPLRGADGTIVGLVATFADLSHRKAAEQALHESRQQLQHAQKMEAVGRLAGGIAHDFNNLLTAIKGSAQFLLLDVPPGHPAREDLEDIDQAVDRAANLTRQLLTFSRKGVVEPRALDLSAVVAGTENLLHRMLRDDITLAIDLAEEPLCIQADSGQVEQVLMNLVVNARDAMPDGGRVTVQTRAVELRGPFGPENPHLSGGLYTLLCVTDTGCGMAPEVQERAFDPFFTTKPQGQGTGLGLSTVYGIVRQSGGLIQLHSEVGLGTTVRIFFPRLSGEGEKPGPAIAAEEMGAGAETLLLVEDEPYVRGVVRRALERSGYRVLLASDGETALEACARHDGALDLLITDVVMPGVSGAELASRMQALRPGLRVLFMSGYTDDEISRHGVLDEGVNFIQKPFSPQSLVTRVREVLDAAAV